MLTSSSGTRACTGDMDLRDGVSDRSKEQEGENKFFYGFVTVDLWAIFFRRQHGFEVL